MHSDLIGKIEKAKHYAEEPERVQINQLESFFHGGNSEHKVTLQEGHWTCTCSFYRSWGTCAHVMAMQKMLDPMLPNEAREPELSIDFQTERVDSVAV